MDTIPTPSVTDRNIDSACATVTQEIARTDSKASLLLAFTGAVLAGLASLADADVPLITKIFGGLAVLALGIAAVLLLLVVRPDLGKGRVVREGLPYWARLEESELHAAMGQDTRITRVKTLSGLATRKYIRLTRAVDTILAALALLALAAIGTAL